MLRRNWPYSAVVALILGVVVLAQQAAPGRPGQAPAGQGAPTSQPAMAGHEHQAAAEVTRAVAVLVPLSNSHVSGVVFFTREGNAVHVTGRITGLTPGLHAFHVHEFGDLTLPDGESAGPHYNPMGMPHGQPTAAQRHAGDFGNIDADGDGTAVIDIRDPVVQLTGPYSILGRGLIVHASVDKFTQPAGDAGARVGGGVIGVANPKSSLTPTGAGAAGGTPTTQPRR